MVEAAARNDAACHEDARASGTVPVEPDATDVNHAPALGMGAAGAGDRSMTGGSGKRAEIDPEVPGPLPERDAATQSIAMGSNVQFIQTHSRPAGDED
ncbi:MAG: hypothetical protein J0H01_09530 [Rhizobiales bacterium]|nr:hypothetical protein [Hyphomicrobiales bacterium]